ncbi:DUF3983 domain-containing protein [Bacillus infantis]|uniref:DUF3983 domain-containing protein n=1 Tax=Bacillus infantis TaxID=324767 RepID=A0A5D4SSJ0_9BACI|nr:DUF3983 domain-containing protein [Bacillus infantis]TYS66347.1 DUF3983 domain-containing protein [Bacillus infantis]
MANKKRQKRRLKKALTRRGKDRTARAWRNIFVKAGILKG